MDRSYDELGPVKRLGEEHLLDDVNFLRSHQMLLAVSTKELDVVDVGQAVEHLHIIV